MTLPDIVAWDEDLATGVEEIDNQHAEMLTRIKDFLNSATSLTPQELHIEGTEFLYFLIHYAKDHLKDEEQLMEQSNYSGKEAHLAQHREYNMHIDALELIHKEEGISQRFIDHLANFVMGWCISHIKSEDVKLASFLKDKPPS